MEESMEKAVVEEESGWTAYFEDFSDNIREQSLSCSSFDSPSLVSDAASGAAWKISDNNNHVVLACSSIKKTRTRKIISHDDSLEDTASSPANSPKVSDLKPIEMNTKKTDDHNNSSLVKEAGHYSDMLTSIEKSKVNLNGNSNYTEMKKRGLCLVPVSMLVNHYLS